MGDLNVGPASPVFQFLQDAGWRDKAEGRDPRGRVISKQSLPHEPEIWMLRREPPNPRVEHIDHILYRGKGLTAHAWRRLASPDPERRFSDHDPIFADFLLHGDRS